MKQQEIFEETELTVAHGSRATVKRGTKRASYQKEQIFKLVDDLKLAHIGFVIDGTPMIIPMTVWRADEAVYFHVANKSRLHRLIERGESICLSLAEGSEWVLSKSAFHHSINYRSAVLFCRGERVVEDGEFDRAFAAIINDIEEGRWQQVREPNRKERVATALIRLTIEEGSYKSREGGPSEEPEDMDLPVWHGTLPIQSGCPFNHTTNESN